MNETLQTRIFELMADRNESVRDVSIGSGVSENIIYRANRTNILLKNLEKLANYFNVSFEFLLGRSEETLGFTPVSPLPDFSQRLKKVAAEQGVSMYALSLNTTVSYVHLMRWRDGAEISLKLLIRLADFLKVTVDYLTGRDS